MIRALVSLYRPAFSRSLVFMLQTNGYRVRPYVKQFWRTSDFSRVEHRLVKTKAARLLLLALRLGITLQVLASIGLCALWTRYHTPGLLTFAAAVFLSYPLVWSHLVILPLLMGRSLIVTPRNHRHVKRSEQAFYRHDAEKIALVGSFGKREVKELLMTVLGTKLKVAAVVADESVVTNSKAFANTLRGDEDVLIIEYDAAGAGGVVSIARITHPSRVIITDVATANLGGYDSADEAGRGLLGATEFIANKSHIYVNGESAAAARYLKGASFTPYSREGALGWTVSNVVVAIDGIAFTMTRYGQSMKIKSHLLGRHNIGPLSLVAALAHEFGLSTHEVATGIANVMPPEHRMRSYRLNSAWIIDDTQNDDIESIRAGTELLKELPAQRKLYAASGFVSQGNESREIHEEMGRLIAASGARVVVLMQNSVAGYIKAGLEQAKFTGEVRIEDKPQEFYSNLSRFVSAGDLVLLQNNWLDNSR